MLDRVACVGSEVVVAVVAVDVEDQLDVDIVCSSCSVDCEQILSVSICQHLSALLSGHKKRLLSITHLNPTFRECDRTIQSPTTLLEVLSHFSNNIR